MRGTAEPEPDLAGARDLVAHVDEVRTRTRAALMRGSWIGYLLWGTLFLGSMVQVIEPDSGVGRFYWFIGVPLVVVVQATIDGRREGRRGLGKRGWPYAVIGVGIFAVNALASTQAGGGVTVAVLWASLGFGFAGFALLQRQPAIAVLLAALAIVSLAILPLGVTPSTMHLGLAAVFGFTFYGIAAGLRSEER